MLTQVLLAKRIYLEACTYAARRDAVGSGLAISMLQDAVELYVWTVIKERNLSAKDQAGFVTHIECLQKAGVSVPNAPKLLELNKARVGFKHYGNLPASSEAKKFQGYVEDFFRAAIPDHFGIEFDSLSLVDLVVDAKVREHIKVAERQIGAGEFKEAAGELARAKTLLFSALHKYIPRVDRGLGDADRVLNSLDGVHGINVFSYLSEYLGALREYTLVSLLRLSLHDYLILRSSLPNASQSMSGQWHLTYTRSNYTAEECSKALSCIVNLSVQLEAFE